MSSGSGWNCKRCTFHHLATGTRCAMCGELRVSKEEMRDFITGKSLSQSRQPKQPPPTTTSAKTTIVNPYARSSKPASSQLSQQSQNHSSKPSIPKPLAHSSTTNDSFKRKLTEAAKTSNPFSLTSSAVESKKQQVASTVRQPFQPGPVPMAMEHADHWIYPAAENFPKRQYQFEITEKAIFYNTLTSLPTGLGKTLIAAVVMYNYYRWFPTGKIIFMAPTLPLVNQQVQACYEIMGIPAKDTALITGKIKAELRTSIWKANRVFFCTPQTVQKDLENNRLDASKVVCVVLDEAHKATGKYPYCTVIEYIEQAGAKFRTLALSATPGTSIKTIQSVVDALRISRIEARSDSDPDVKQYIHQRETEVIVVSNSSALDGVRRALSAIIDPLLDELRNAGAFPQNFPSNATVVSYNLLQARESYQKRPDAHGGITAKIVAAHWFVQLRADLHNQGIGIVRNKVAQLKNGILNKNYLKNFLHKKEFQALWNEIESASWGPESSEINANQVVEQKLQKNPKLTKLREILTEHFERTRACGASSRAIVFSQFRDSVQEIEQVLNMCQPLLRPRHFIGQGRGGSNSSSSSDDPTASSLKGMNQNEQQKAIREFSEGVYNVLVCTCIGEEGLDIGEVDIIVNFDCLRSPIRMIQRVGRTGRKRNGRVVCLASAGAEERTLKKSQVDERKLHHALKNPRSFTMNPSIPMFAKDPVVLERNMGVAENFHMSQVDGAEKKKQRSALNVTSAGQERYRLTEMEERRRFHVLGDLTRVCFEEITGPTELRRRFLSARELAMSSRPAERKRRKTSGRITQMLQTFEDLYGVETNNTSFSRPSRSRRMQDGKSLLDTLFPLHLSFEKSPADSIFSKIETARDNLVSDVKLDNAESEEPMLNLESFQYGRTMRESPHGLQQTTTISLKDCGTTSQSRESFNRTTNNYSFRETFASKAAKENTTARFMESSNGDFTSMDQSESNVESLRFLKSKQNTSSVPGSLSLQPFAPAKSTNLNPVNVTHSEDPLVDKSVTANNDIFRLPSQDDNNDIFRLPSQDHDDSSADGSQVSVSHDEKMQISEEDIRRDTIDDGKHALASQETDNAGKDCFRLPTPSSSSEEESDDEYEMAAREYERASETLSSGSLPKSMNNSLSNGDHCQSSLDCAKNSQEVDSIEEDDISPILARGRPAAKRNKPVLAIQDTQDSPSGPLAKNHSETQNHAHTNLMTSKVHEFSSEKTVEYSENLSIFHTQTSMTKVRFSVEPVDNMSIKEIVDSVALPRRKAALVKNKRIFAIEDTPNSHGESLLNAVSSNSDTTMESNKFFEDLKNTQDTSFSSDCESIVCAICFGKQSPDFDPIILCDGFGNKTCNFAVHVTCYNANVDLSDENSIWRCDVCEYLQEGGTRSDMQCCLCFGISGVLKRSTGNVWQHPRCDAKDKKPTRLHKLTHLDTYAPRSKKKEDNAPANYSRRRPLTHLSTNIDAVQENDALAPLDADAEIRKKRRKEFYQKFIDDEAEASDDDEIDEQEEKEIKAIEEDEAELAEGFINDSSQLGYTQDELDIDPLDDGVTHRALDNERERMRQFSTPMMNRLMMRQSDTPASAPDSDKGLGRMHFIRSVLEHHRRGGRAEEIEELYQQLEKDVENDATSVGGIDSWDSLR